MGRVFIAGSINMDVVATADRHPQVGETVAGDAVLYFPGGKGATDGKVVPEIDRIVKPQPPEPPAPVPVLVDRPEADPAAESARQVRLAKAAFAAGEYGHAADHLERAIKAKPDDPQPHALTAQVRLAAGQYADAVTAIQNGMKLDDVGRSARHTVGPVKETHARDPGWRGSDLHREERLDGSRAFRRSVE